MTAAALKKYRTYLTDDKGKPVMVQLDLRNKIIKSAYQKMIKELEDISDWELYEQYKANPNKETSDFFEVTNQILAEK